MEPLGPSAGFREHAIVVPGEIELTDAVVDLVGAWAAYKWGMSAGIVQVDREARTIMVRGPDVESVAAEIGRAIARGEPPGRAPGAKRKTKRRS